MAALRVLASPPATPARHPAEAWEEPPDPFAGPVAAVTPARWCARQFDRFLVFGADGRVYEADEPVWDEARVQRAR